MNTTGRADAVCIGLFCCAHLLITYYKMQYLFGEILLIEMACFPSADALYVVYSWRKDASEILRQEAFQPRALFQIFPAALQKGPDHIGSGIGFGDKIAQRTGAADQLAAPDYISGLNIYCWMPRFLSPSGLAPNS